MSLWVLRLFFLLVSAGAGWQVSRLTDFEDPFWGILFGVAAFIIVFALEATFTARESVAALLAVVFGIAVGIVLTIPAYSITTLILDPDAAQNPEMSAAIRLILTVMLCYLCTVIVFRTRDRFRFVIPYVEFKRQQKGPRALVLDTSVLIDGRIAGVCRSGFIETPVFVPHFVLGELHKLADSEDRLKRMRGRRGLDLLNQLQRMRGVDVRIYESEHETPGPVDTKLVALARELEALVCTTDFNLNKVAVAQGVDVLNLNELASALRPSVIPGEIITLRINRRGEEEGQAVGYLDDGTMVVVEHAEAKIGKDAHVEITRVLQRTSGRIIFGKLA
ncbi:MAG: TRAM domain-containing protein [Candidatus Brocadiae bacterium]|nr:TRAM domain-containing protein [Candidatus Brocadiia bacterium]